MSNKVNKNGRRRVAMLGAGYISKFHVEAVRTLADVELCAVCDLSQDKAKALQHAYGIPKSYGSLETMLAEERLDVVHVLLPPNVHTASVIRLLEAGVDVLSEKPLGATSADCNQMAKRAKELGRALGVSHNFLFSPNYERFFADLREGRFGRVDQIDIVWNKALGQLKGGPFGGWLFARPENVLFEVGPHSFAHLAHLVGSLEELTVSPNDRIELPRGGEFFRRWEIIGWKGGASVRLRFAFIDGFTQHYIHVRGTAAAGVVDFEQGTYVRNEHTAQVLDLDRYVTATAGALASVVQASETLGRFMLTRMGLAKEGAPFQRSITRCVRSFYEGLDVGLVDERLSAGLATMSVELAERVVGAAKLAPAKKPPKKAAVAASPTIAVASETPETVLVTGGTGFIGQALVRKLREAGHGVRLLARDPAGVPAAIKQLGVGVVRGDFADTAALEAALPGVQYVYHLARGVGETWDDYVRNDVEPTRRFAELCLKFPVKRFFYTSTIAIYYAGKHARTITEDTPPHPGVLRNNLYSRCKVEIENMLLAMQKERGLGVVIFRPGIVLGPGGNPLHQGVAGFPFSSVSRLWGDGRYLLPIVLVDDCADAMARALDKPGIEGESFNLVGEPCLTAQEYLDELERAAGVKFRRVPTSSVRYFVEDLGKYVIKTVGRDPQRRLPSYASWDGRTCAARFDATRAREKLGWNPTNDRERVIREGIVAPAVQFLS